jgi:preprotein translocase subunit SecF
MWCTAIVQFRSSGFKAEQIMAQSPKANEPRPHIPEKVIDFMRIRHYSTAFSVILTLICIVGLILKPLNFSLDFTGGTLLELSWQSPVSPGEIREALESYDYHGISVVHYGSEREILVRMQANLTTEQGKEIVEQLQKKLPDNIATLKRTENVGPQVGEELKQQGFLALALALIGVMIYVAFRFQFKYAVGGVVSLFHDAIVVLGLFAWFGWEFDLNVLAAVLAIIGYSINDTVVIFDRIRENFREMRKTDTAEIINVSMTQMLGRTIQTTVVTMLAVIALFFFGGESIHGFAKAMWIGMTVGVYSTIYVASNILMIMKLTREDMIVPVKEGGDLVDDRP